MPKATIQTIYDAIDRIAPFELQEEFDNAGLIIGRMDEPVERVLVCLDVTPAVLREAKQRRAQLLVSHHPLLFHATKRIHTDAFEGALIQELLISNLSLLSAHTNLDQSPLNAAALVLKRLQCSSIRQVGPYIQAGDLPTPMPAMMLGKKLAAILGSAVRAFGSGQTMVRTIAMAGGAYDEGWQEARDAGAQVYLTGEVRHHNALAAAESGFLLLDGGHYQTEVPMVAALRGYLQREMDALQYLVEVYAAESPAASAGYTL